MFDWVLWVVFSLPFLYFACKKGDKCFAEDLIVTLKKAHLGKLPAGVYAEQIVSAKTFSRDELRVPLDAETLRRMDACVDVSKHDVQFGIVSSKMNLRSQVTVSLLLSLRFEGETAEGETVRVNIEHAFLTAYIERDKIRGMALRTLKKV